MGTSEANPDLIFYGTLRVELFGDFPRHCKSDDILAPSCMVFVSQSKILASHPTVTIEAAFGTMATAVMMSL